MPGTSKTFREPRKIGVVALPGFALMSFSAALEPFRAANLLSGQTLYEIVHVDFLLPDQMECRSSQGLVLDRMMRPSQVSGLDMVFVIAGGEPLDSIPSELLAWLRTEAERGTKLCGVSGGPLLLAAAGLLDGYRCTVHWQHSDFMIEKFPNIFLTRSIYVEDRGRMSCAGGIAPIDMVFSILQREHGPQFAAKVSDWFLHTNIRGHTAPQTIEDKTAEHVNDKRVRAAIAIINAELTNAPAVSELAKRVACSESALRRAFVSDVGISPKAFINQVRLRAAKHLIETSQASITEIALATGFSSLSHLTTAFKTQFGSSPKQMRR